MQIDVTVQDANNILCEVTPPQPQIIVIDRGVEGNGIVSIVPVTISTFQYLRITYTNGTVQDVGPLTSTAYTATAPITIVGNTISLATVPIASGGTDATTAAGAIQNLLPSYTGNGNKRLGLNALGTALEWVLDGGGTVTSVAASGGTTGLTFTGSPITTSGTLTLGGTLAVANGGTGVTSSTGTGSVVLSTSPTLVTPVLGTPTSGNFSTGTFTWPTFNQNTTGTAANITATSNSTLTTLSALSLPGSQVSGNISGNAANVTGVVAIANGGTGQITANAALNALLPTQTGNASKYLQTDGTNATWDAISLSTADITGILPTANGGTGLSSFTANGVVYASSTSALTTGSALTFDGANLGVLSAGLNVGDGTTTLRSVASGGVGLFGTSTNHPLAFRLNNTEEMRLTSTGLGIGTTTPAAKLDVTANAVVMGYFRSSGGSANDKRFTITSGGDRVVLDSASNSTGVSAAFSFTLGGTEGMRLTSTGLGIGTSSPTVKLDVSSAITNGYTPMVRLTRPSATLNDQFLAFYNGIATDAQIGRLKNSDDLLFGFNSGVSFSAAMTLTTSGNLGIGSTSPSNKLVVNGSSGTTNIQIADSTASNNLILGVNTSTVDIKGLNGYPMVFYTANTERMRIDNVNGYVGIGTNSPTKKLDIRGTNAGELALIQINNDSISGAPTIATMEFACLGSAKASIAAAVYADGYMAFRTNNNTEKMRLDASGNLMVGGTTASRKVTITDTATGGNIQGIRIVGNAGNYYDIGRVSDTGEFTVTGNQTGVPLMTWVQGGSERMRIDSSGDLGIGTTDPITKLQVNSGSSFVAGFKSTVANGYIALQDSGTSGALTDGNVAIGAISNDLAFRSGGATRMRLDSAGNLGLGVAPSAWVSPALPAFDIGTMGAIAGQNNAANLHFLSNAYLGSGPAWKYKTTNYASRFTAGNDSGTGGFSWYTAPSGTAGTAITFTQAMTLHASGGLSIGNTTDLGAKTLNVGITSASTNTLVGRINFQGYNTTYGAGMASYIPSGAPGIDWQDLRFYTSQGPSAINVEVVRIDTSGNLLVGTTSSSTGIDTGNTRMFVVAPNSSFGAAITAVADSQGRTLRLTNQARNVVGVFDAGNSTVNIGSNSGNDVAFLTSGVERARIDTSGNLLVGTTSGSSARIRSYFDGSTVAYGIRVGTTATSANAIQFVYEPSTQVGTISTTTSATAYNTSSDYRLKNTITPMTGALAKVAQLKPVTYKWNIDGSDGEGFIAHELAEVIPQAVSGEKDAVNEDGSIKPQGIDTSFLVATLTAAIQELKAEFDAYKASHP